MDLGCRLQSASFNWPLNTFVATYEGAFFANLYLNGACLATGISLLDLTGRFLDQRNFFALSTGRTMSGLQVTQQTLFVSVTELVRCGRFDHASRLELLKQGGGCFFEFVGKLGDGRTEHFLGNLCCRHNKP